MNIIRKNMRTLSLNRQGQVECAKIRYVAGNVKGEFSSDDEMLAYLLETAPEKIGNAVKSSVELVDCRTPDVFEMELTYTTPATPAGGTGRSTRRHGERIWSSKCNVTKEKCFETLERQEIFPAEGSVYSTAGYSPVWNGRFGEDASIDGVDKLVPRCEERCRKFVLASQCTGEYRRKILALVGKINSGSFRGWASKEVMLTGLEISEPFLNDLDQSLVEIEFSFSIRTHRRNVEWCGIEVGKVNGWDHLWGTFYADPADRIIRGNCAYVGRIYSTADFGILSLED